MSAVEHRTSRAIPASWRTLAAIALTLLAAGQVFPAELAEDKRITIGVHLGTAHLGDRGAPRGGWESINPGLYIRLASGVTAGAYRNSIGRNSAYLAWTVSTENDRFALTVGAVSGYGGIKPMLAPSMRFGLSEATSVRLTLLAAPKASPAIHLSTERRF